MSFKIQRKKAYKLCLLVALLLVVSMPATATLLPQYSGLVKNQSWVAQSKQKNTFPVTRMGVGGIRLGITNVEVQGILGRPKKIKIEETNCCGELKEWIYPDIIVKFEVLESKKNTVYNVFTKSKKFATVDGIRVGDSRSKVLKVYGKNFSSSSQDTLYYSNDEYASFIVFKFEKQKLVEIAANVLLT